MRTVRKRLQRKINEELSLSCYFIAIVLEDLDVKHGIKIIMPMGRLCKIAIHNLHHRIIKVRISMFYA